MSTEERVRIAAKAMGDTVHHIRPLDIHAETADFRAPAKPARRRPLGNWQGWLVPMTAAAAVVAVAATLVAVRGSSDPATASHSISAATSSTSMGASSGIPPYYVAANDIHGVATNTAAVIETRTGALVDVFKLPVNQAWGVAASASDNTFVVDRGLGGDGQSFAMDVLRVPASNPAKATMTPLKLAAASFNEKASVGGVSYTQNQVSAVAVSPDGQTVAVFSKHVTKTKIQQFKNSQGKTVQSVAEPTSAEAVLQTFSLSTGQALRTWTGPVPGPGADVNLTWLDDGHTVAWDAVVTNSSETTMHDEFELLNTTAPGTSLTANSRLVFHILANTACEQPIVSLDGESVICGDANNNKVLELVSYSLSTGKLEHVLYQYKGALKAGNIQALWALSGSLAIGAGQVDGKHGWSDFNGVMTRGTLTPLPTIATGDEGLSGAVF